MMQYKKPTVWGIILTLIPVAIFCVGFYMNYSSDKTLTQWTGSLQVQDIDKIQVIDSMGNPQYGADSKIILEKGEIRQFIDTFNSGVISSKVKDEEIKVGFSSRYTLYKDEKVVAEFSFNSNDTGVIWWDDEYRHIAYDAALKTPFELYKQSQGSQIIVDQDGNEMDLIRYNGETYVKSKLPQETIEWLEMYNALSQKEQIAISFSPDLGEPFSP